MPNFIRGGARIYTEPASRGRIVAHLDATDEETRPQTPDETNRSDTYLTTLLKLIPAEIVSLYIAFRDLWSEHDYLWAWFWICLASCLILRVYANMPQTAGATVWQTQKTNVVISCIAFFLWAHSIGPKPPLAFLDMAEWVAAPLVAVFSVLAPIFAPGDSSAPENAASR